MRYALSIAAPNSAKAVSTPPIRIGIHWLSWLTVALMICIGSNGVILPNWIQYLPFLVSIVLFGLPHGAIDHLTPFWMDNEAITRRKLFGFILLYLALMGLYLLYWTMAPAAAFVFFIGMTWFHWGQGDLYTLVGLFHAQHLDRSILRLATLVVRGGLPMFVPLLAFPDTYQAVANDTIALFATDGAIPPDYLFSTNLRWTGGLLFAALILFTLTWSWFSCPANKRQGWWLDTFEIGLLFLYFLVVPPLLAVGLYFCLWHAVRHILRLQQINQETDQALGLDKQWVVWCRFFKDAAPLTAAALGLLALLYWAVPQTPQTLGAHLGLYLALIAALTFPHTLLVSWLDFRQGVWGAR